MYVACTQGGSGLARRAQDVISNGHPSGTAEQRAGPEERSNVCPSAPMTIINTVWLMMSTYQRHLTVFCPPAIKCPRYVRGPDVTLVRITTKIQKNKNASFKKYGKKTCTRYISSRYVLTYDQRTQTKNERHVGTPGAPAIFSKQEQDY